MTDKQNTSDHFPTVNYAAKKPASPLNQLVRLLAKAAVSEHKAKQISQKDENHEPE